MTRFAIRQVAHQSPDYIATVQLRQDILRTPLGLVFGEDDLAREADQWHYGLWKDDQLLACLVIVPLPERTWKMRQVAVQSRWQGKGIGQQLVRHIEALALTQGVARIALHARANVVPFYEKLGYALVGEPFTEVGIPHRKMEKHLPLAF
ncbi:MAG: GNAT family N-acetyltransferase [Bernardetiaceae bacterium]